MMRLRCTLAATLFNAISKLIAQMKEEREAMPFVGLGFHILIALFFAVHAVRTGREIYWLIILFSFPLLGSIVYFLVVYLPSSRIEHGVRKAGKVAIKALDPGRSLREAQQAYDLTPTAQNQIRLAQALLAAGETDRAVQLFDTCLQGPFADQADIRFGAAQAHFRHGDAQQASELSQHLLRHHPDYQTEQVMLLLAQTYAKLDRREEARQMFAATVARFDSIEARAEYAIWAYSVNDKNTAEQLQREIELGARHWNKHTRTLYRPLLRRLEAAAAR